MDVFRFRAARRPIALREPCRDCQGRRAIPFYATSLTLYVKCTGCGLLMTLARSTRRRRMSSPT
jgi:hypothetical protein